MKTQRGRFNVSYRSSNCLQTTTLLSGKNFWFDLEAMNAFCLKGLPPRLLDLLRIASSVYVVDRLVKRRSTKDCQASSRTIGLKIAVLELDFWRQDCVRKCISECLDLLTGDYWDVEFEPDTHAYYMDTNFLSFPKTGLSPLVCLYSGGLDSAAGLVARISESPTRPVFPVTVWHQPRQRHLVDHQYQFLRRHYRERSVAVEINPLIIKVAMSWSSNYAKKHQETSQRSRSFLFTAVGAITAIMNGQRHIEMFESGVGAINLPLMAGMVGSKATKSSHPEFLRTMSKLVSLIADDEVKFTLPFVSKTKGELVSSLAVDDLGSLAHMTASCIHYPIRKKHFKQCGLCPGCIFRRSALRAAGIDEDGNLYGYDFLGQPDLINHLPDNRLRFLSAFLLQVAHLRNIENEERLPSMFERHVVPGIVPKGESQKGVIELLGRYRDEWLEIVAEARERGHAWATLLVPEQPATPRANHVPV